MKRLKLKHQNNALGKIIFFILLTSFVEAKNVHEREHLVELSHFKISISKKPNLHDVIKYAQSDCSLSRHIRHPDATACKNAGQLLHAALQIRGGKANPPTTDQVAKEVEMINVPESLFSSGSERRTFRHVGDQNGRPAYKSGVSERGQIPIFLYWSGNQWMLNYDEDPSLNILNCLAYSKMDETDPLETSGSWYIRDGRRWVPAKFMEVVVSGKEQKVVEKLPSATPGMPPLLRPVFFSFIIDNIGTGMVLPSLPFFVMDLGATPFQLGLVVALTYMAQTLGCLVLGRVSDRYGRRPVLLACVGGSVIAYYTVSIATNLYQVALARMIGGLLGALVPVSQACIADQCPVDLRTKYLGILQAAAGAGFVLGPVLGLVLRKLCGMSMRGVFKAASLMALVGTTYTALKLKETKVGLGQTTAATASMIKRKKEPLPLAISLLTGNGFLLMYAFSIETVYAMFIKDNFGYGESVLSTVFALNGIIVGILQVFFIKKLVNLLGKHMLLVVGNLLLALGMVGLALIRQPIIHFKMFSIHILGYAIADTALSALISRYSSANTQGLYLGLNQAAQSCARMISPLIAGALYERSKRMNALPLGALPYLAGAGAPLVAIVPPFFLYLRSVRKKIKDNEIQPKQLKPLHRLIKGESLVARKDPKTHLEEQIATADENGGDTK